MPLYPPASSGSGVTSSESVLAVDTAMVSGGFVDVCSLALPAGNYIVSGNAVGSTPGGGVTTKIWDGTTVYASGYQYNGVIGGNVCVPITDHPLTLTGPTTVKLSVGTAAASGTVRTAAPESGTGTASTLTRLCALKVS